MMIPKMKGRVFAGIGAFLGILCIFYFLLYLPKIAYRKNLNTRISQQERMLVQLAKKPQELEALKTEHQRILEDLLFVRDKFQGTHASFLHELGKRGEVYGIEYVNIIPLSSQEEEYYRRTPVRIDLYGSFHNLGMLLSDMAGRGELGSFTVDSLSLKSSLKENYTIEANLTLSLYKYKNSAPYTARTVNSDLTAGILSSQNFERRTR